MLPQIKTQLTNEPIDTILTVHYQNWVHYMGEKEARNEIEFQLANISYVNIHSIQFNNLCLTYGKDAVYSFFNTIILNRRKVG